LCRTPDDLAINAGKGDEALRQHVVVKAGKQQGRHGQMKLALPITSRRWPIIGAQYR
jgi:hypothetical protein